MSESVDKLQIALEVIAGIQPILPSYYELFRNKPWNTNKSLGIHENKQQFDYDVKEGCCWYLADRIRRMEP